MEPLIEIPNAATHNAAVAAGIAAAAGAAEHPIHRVLRTCGVALLLAACMTFIEIDGLDSLSAFAQLNGDSDVTEMAKPMASRPVTVGRVILGMLMHIKRIQALVFWVKDHDKRGLVAEPELWDEDAMADAMERKEAEHNYGKINVGIINPGKCRVDHGWDNWQSKSRLATSSMLPWALPSRSLSTTLYVRRTPVPRSSSSRRKKRGAIRCL